MCAPRFTAFVYIDFNLFVVKIFFFLCRNMFFFFMVKYAWFYLFISLFSLVLFILILIRDALSYRMIMIMEILDEKNDFNVNASYKFSVFWKTTNLIDRNLNERSIGHTELTTSAQINVVRIRNIRKFSKILKIFFSTSIFKVRIQSYRFERNEA